MELPGYRPLYRQVYDIVVGKVAQGVWKPGEALPSEQALARELGVSQGTMRKVLDALTAEKVLERHQGKGTFIAENTQERALFRFFRMVRADGSRVTPDCGAETVKVRASRAVEQQKLDLEKGDRVVEIRRIRLLEGKPAIRETIVLPAALFPGIEARQPLPNTLYSLYQTDFGVNIVAANERLGAEIADAEDHKLLGAPVGAPLLTIDRIALSLQDRKVEWRLSRVYAPHLAYAITLS
ncbi:GntR family transcriptional regulator [Sphingosinicella microcystinivorans]|uniref:GntR family transcriptional regulator n=1 Tax=Sphingosinicella microcystinivorans TaxID=335406 RepID=UPI0022F3D9CB|nr:GntR family transcriptional regulator [Sphingosinicella microcystinivorans]WBX84515.1 GntR family transcriptional regulator [Sphingosinicella microcystinivorans]